MINPADNFAMLLLQAGNSQRYFGAGIFVETEFVCKQG